MRKAIESDFDVSFLGTTGKTSLFAGFRKGGTTQTDTPDGLFETHTAGVWHFISATESNPDASSHRIAIKQWHVPRYRIASVAKTLRKGAGRRSPDPNRSEDLRQDLQLHRSGDGAWAISCQNKQPLSLPQKLSTQIDEEIRLLDQSQRKIQMVNEEYEYDGLRTPEGSIIRHPCRVLVEAIAFEKATLPDLFAGNFGVYSAYCTYRDFSLAQELPSHLMQELVKTQFEYDPEEIDPSIRSLFRETQNRLLEEPIWDTEDAISLSQACRILHDGMSRMPIERRVQFVLMNGMHSAGLFLPLAVLSDCTSFDTYCDLMTQGYQPDSGEEQVLRIETAYISLYGDLAACGTSS